MIPPSIPRPAWESTLHPGIHSPSKMQFLGIRAQGAGLRCVGVSIRQQARGLIAADADCVIENLLGDSRAKLPAEVPDAYADMRNAGVILTTVG